MKQLPLLALVAALAAASVPVHAASDEQRAAAREKYKNMTPEEKAAAKEKMKEKWDSMSPEEQEAAKKRFAEKHPRAAKRLEEKKKDGATTTP